MTQPALKPPAWRADRDKLGWLQAALAVMLGVERGNQTSTATKTVCVCVCVNLLCSWPYLFEQFSVISFYFVNNSHSRFGLATKYDFL